MKGELNGYRIEIPDPPVVEGWEAVEFRGPRTGDIFYSLPNGKLLDWPNISAFQERRWIMRRKPRRRIVFEECAEPVASVEGWAFALLDDGSIEEYSAYHSLPQRAFCWLRRTDEEVGG